MIVIYHFGPKNSKKILDPTQLLENAPNASKPSDSYILLPSFIRKLKVSPAEAELTNVITPSHHPHQSCSDQVNNNWYVDMFGSLQFG